MTAALFVGTRKGLFVLDEDSAITDHHFAGVPISAVLHDRRDGTWYAALDHGHFGSKLHRSADQGVTWTELDAPMYAPDAGVVTKNPMDPHQVPATLKLMWTLEAAHPDQPGVIFCGTVPGGLFRSTDRGETWSLEHGLWDRPERAEAFGGGYDEPGMHSVSIDPRGPGRMIVGLSCGGAWFTDDDGASWDLGRGMAANYMPPDRIDDPRIQDAHRVVRCDDAPDVVWTQHHCGIFRSVDNGRTWGEITEAGPSTFGFAVAAHPHDPETAWFVPGHSDILRIPVDGQMVVTRTRDGGRSFDVLGNGLPQQHAYHLIYRHGLDVADDGQRLALGSTTGSLWTTDDAGDSFRRVTAELPPVLCVRWI